MGGACNSGAAPPGGNDADAGQWSACVWEGTRSSITPNVSLTGNNTADLSGADLGAATIDAAVQRKKIAVQVDGLTAELTVGDGYLSRLTSTTEDAYLSIALTNVGDRVLCSIKGSSYRWLDAGGSPLAMPDPSDKIYVGGSVAALPSGDFTDSCLGPGEKGYFTDVKTTAAGVALFAQAAAVAFVLSGPFNVGTPPAGKLVPQAYDVGTCPDKRAVKVNLLNSGTDKVALEPYSLSPAILIDDAGLPAGWMYLEAPGSVTVAAGGTTTVYSSLSMEPKVSRMQVYVDFTLP